MKRPVTTIDPLGNRKNFDSITAAADYLDSNPKTVWTALNKYKYHQTVRDHKIEYLDDHCACGGTKLPESEVCKDCL